MSDCRFGVSPVNYPDPELRRCLVATGSSMRLGGFHFIPIIRDFPVPLFAFLLC